MRKSTKTDPDEMLPEYDFTGADRGKFFQRYQTMRLKISLDPDVARVFPTSKAVNDMLRAVAAAMDRKHASRRSVRSASARRRKAG